MATMKKPTKKVVGTKMKDGGPIGKKKLMKVPYPKDKNMSSQDSSAFKLGANIATGKGSGDAEGYTGITSNKYYEKGKTATKVAKASASKEKMKMGGSVKAKSGASLKPVNSDKNPGLSKLPTPVRNKMGYQKNGGAMKKCKYGCK